LASTGAPFSPRVSVCGFPGGRVFPLCHQMFPRGAVYYPGPDPRVFFGDPPPAGGKRPPPPLGGTPFFRPRRIFPLGAPPRRDPPPLGHDLFRASDFSNGPPLFWKELKNFPPGFLEPSRLKPQILAQGGPLPFA